MTDFQAFLWQRPNGSEVEASITFEADGSPTVHDVRDGENKSVRLSEEELGDLVVDVECCQGAHR